MAAVFTDSMVRFKKEGYKPKRGIKLALKVEGGAKGADMIAGSRGDAAAIERLRADPSINAILHTACVATQISGGHAPNALPQRATTNVNCRIFPGHKQERHPPRADPRDRRSGSEGRTAS